MTQAQPELVELYRVGLKGALDWMKASLENAERLQNQQLMAIRRGIEAHVKSASELGAAKSIDELLAVQTRMAGAQMARVMGYWASLYENQLAAYSNAAAQTLEGTRQAEATMRAAINAARRETSAAR